MLKSALKKLLRAFTAFILVLWNDPITAHQKITEILGIRG